MKVDLEDLMQRVCEWQAVTFTQSTCESKLHHMKEEIDEVIESQGDLLEWADLMILLMGAAAKAGFTMEEILVGVEAKLIINKRRKWGEPDSRGVVKHTEGV
jgi:predicted house-cleaning noncanonical NTP pyrophosphatase (MazG superfamily)